MVARLEVLEDYFPNNEAEIRVFYDEVDKHFAREDLSTETLVKLARQVYEQHPAARRQKPAARRGAMR